MDNLSTTSAFEASVAFCTFAPLFMILYLLGRNYLLEKFRYNKWIYSNFILIVILFITGCKVLYVGHVDKTLVPFFVAIMVVVNLYLLISTWLNSLKLWKKLVVEFVFIFICGIGLMALISILYHTSIFEGTNWYDPFFFALIVSFTTLFFINLRSVLMPKMHQRDIAVRNSILKKEQAQGQLEALRYKMNPHFLYNSLNSIAGLAKVDGVKTQQMALSLSQFYRNTITNNTDGMVTVEEEFETVRAYLEIEKIRFGDRFDYDLHSAKDAQKFQIPALLLQPLVENCIKHGMHGMTEKVTIVIEASIEAKKLMLSVKDNGAPFASDLRMGYGIKSVYDRLELMFPEKHQVEILTEPEKEIRIEIDTTVLMVSDPLQGKSFKGKFEYCHIFPDRIVITHDPEIGDLVADYQKNTTNFLKTLMVSLVVNPLLVAAIIFYYQAGMFDQPRISMMNVLTMILGPILICIAPFYLILKTSGTPLIYRDQLVKVKDKEQFNLVIFYIKENGRTKKRTFILAKDPDEQEKALRILHSEGLI